MVAFCTLTSCNFADEYKVHTDTLQPDEDVTGQLGMMA
jgi:hypothetical protein